MVSCRFEGKDGKLRMGWQEGTRKLFCVLIHQTGHSSLAPNHKSLDTRASTEVGEVLIPLKIALNFSKKFQSLYKNLN